MKDETSWVNKAFADAQKRLYDEADRSYEEYQKHRDAIIQTWTTACEDVIGLEKLSALSKACAKANQSTTLTQMITLALMTGFNAGFKNK